MINIKFLASVILMFSFVARAGDANLKSTALYDKLNLSVYAEKFAKEFLAHRSERFISYLNRISKGTPVDEMFIKCITREMNQSNIEKLFRINSIEYLADQKSIDFYLNFAEVDDVKVALKKMQPILMKKIDNHINDNFVNESSWFDDVDVEGVSYYFDKNPSAKKPESLVIIDKFFIMQSDVIYFGKEKMTSKIFDICKEK